jgi:hypothetical protein
MNPGIAARAGVVSLDAPRACASAPTSPIRSGATPQHRPDMNPELDQNNPESQAALETCRAQGGRRRCAVRTSFEAVVSEGEYLCSPSLFPDRSIPSRNRRSRRTVPTSTSAKRRRTT